MKKLMITFLTVALYAGSLQAYAHEDREDNEHAISKETKERKDKKKRNNKKRLHEKHKNIKPDAEKEATIAH